MVTVCYGMCMYGSLWYTKIELRIEWSIVDRRMYNTHRRSFLPAAGSDQIFGQSDPISDNFIRSHVANRDPIRIFYFLGCVIVGLNSILGAIVLLYCPYMLLQ